MPSRYFLHLFSLICDSSKNKPEIMKLLYIIVLYFPDNFTTPSVEVLMCKVTFYVHYTIRFDDRNE